METLGRIGRRRAVGRGLRVDRRDVGRELGHRSHQLAELRVAFLQERRMGDDVVRELLLLLACAAERRDQLRTRGL